MKELGVRRFPATKTHPQSIGLSERYIQLTPFSLRTFLKQYPSAIRTWDVFLGNTIHALNYRTIGVMGYTPLQLIGFNPARPLWDPNPKTTSHLDELGSYVQEVVEGAHPLPSALDPELRVAALDEIRHTALDSFFKVDKSIIRREARKRRWMRSGPYAQAMLERYNLRNPLPMLPPLPKTRSIPWVRVQCTN